MARKNYQVASDNPGIVKATSCFYVKTCAGTPVAIYPVSRQMRAYIDDQTRSSE
jgi:hypothetical protein